MLIKFYISYYQIRDQRVYFVTVKLKSQAGYGGYSIQWLFGFSGGVNRFTFFMTLSWVT